jgi:hypothetical protein
MTKAAKTNKSSTTLDNEGILHYFVKRLALQVHSFMRDCMKSQYDMSVEHCKLVR